MASDVNAMLGQAYLRLSAALLVEVFGSPEQRNTVGRLFDPCAPKEEKDAVRAGLDRVAGKMFGGQ